MKRIADNQVVNIIMILAAVLYVILPTDVVNDLIPVLGQVDDIVVGIVTVMALLRRADRS